MPYIIIQRDCGSVELKEAGWSGNQPSLPENFRYDILSYELILVKNFFLHIFEYFPSILLKKINIQ